MRKMAGRLKNVIARWFEGTSDKKIVDAINIENTQSMYRFSVIVAVIDDNVWNCEYGQSEPGNEAHACGYMCGGVPDSCRDVT